MTCHSVFIPLPVDAPEDPLEADLANRVERARARFHETCLRLEALIEQPAADARALADAFLANRTATENYSSALRAFTDGVIQRKPPGVERAHRSL